MFVKVLVSNVATAVHHFLRAQSETTGAGQTTTGTGVEDHVTATDSEATCKGASPHVELGTARHSTCRTAP
jgi:hypothetical protein